MEAILKILLCVGCYLMTLLFVFQKNKLTGNKGLTAIVILILWSVSTAVIEIFSKSTGGSPLLLTLLTLIFTILSILRIFTFRRELHRIPALMLVLYCLCIVTVTLFLRIGKQVTTIRSKPLFGLIELLKTHSTEDIQHELLNVFMFLPIGFLMPCTHRDHTKNSLAQVILFACTFSTAIESMQLLFNLGMCDINDILTNTLGALAGYLVYRILPLKKLF